METPDAERLGLSVSRRRLLKLLAASGAVVALERLLPGKWAVPAVAGAEADMMVAAQPSLPLFISTLAATKLDGNATHDRWRINFSYNDSLGLLKNSSLLTAGVISTGNTTPNIIYNGLPLSLANGAVFVTGNYSLIPNSTLFGTVGNGLFAFSAPAAALVAQSAQQSNQTLEYFLEEPPGRSSNTAAAALGDPTAVTLDDFVVGGTGSAASLAAAAGVLALGAATVKALAKRDEKSSPS